MADSDGPNDESNADKAQPPTPSHASPPDVSSPASSINDSTRDAITITIVDARMDTPMVGVHAELLPGEGPSFRFLASTNELGQILKWGWNQSKNTMDQEIAEWGKIKHPSLFKDMRWTLNLDLRSCFGGCATYDFGVRLSGGPGFDGDRMDWKIRLFEDGYELVRMRDGEL